MKASILAATVAVVAGVAATPANAHEGHASCKTFGQSVRANADAERPFGQLVSNAATRGFLSALIEESHTVEGLCDPRD